MKTLSLIVLFVSLAATAHAHDISVYGREYTLYCGYYTGQEGEYDITYHDQSLPWGTKVKVIAGWAGSGGYPSGPFEWRYRTEYDMEAVSPYAWRTRITKGLHERSSSEFITRLDFVFQLTEPDGNVRYVNGGSSWGFYEIPVGASSISTCINKPEDKPAMQARGYEVIRRD